MANTVRDSPSAVAIRSAAIADIDDVLRVWTQSETHPTVTDDAAGLTQLLADAPGALLVAEEGGEIVGTVIAGWNGWRGSIYRIAVAPSHRRLGVARALLDAAVANLIRLGARRIDAFVLRDDEQARSFWDSMRPAWVLDPLDKARYVRG